MKRVERAPSLRERAEIAIRGGIITGEIPPGEIFSAPVLAKQLGVSATPVREAMLDLVREGMVEPIANRRGYSDEHIEGIAGVNFRRVFALARGAATAT